MQLWVPFLQTPATTLWKAQNAASNADFDVRKALFLWQFGRFGNLASCQKIASASLCLA